MSWARVEDVSSVLLLRSGGPTPEVEFRGPKFTLRSSSSSTPDDPPSQPLTTPRVGLRTGRFVVTPLAPTPPLWLRPHPTGGSGGTVTEGRGWRCRGGRVLRGSATDLQRRWAPGGSRGSVRIPSTSGVRPRRGRGGRRVTTVCLLRECGEWARKSRTGVTTSVPRDVRWGLTFTHRWWSSPPRSVPGCSRGTWGEEVPT